MGCVWADVHWDFFSYASRAAPQPDWLVPVADEVDALEVVVLVDWAAARLATARTRAVVYCMLIDLLRMLWLWL
jgi:hypothetical protein